MYIVFDPDGEILSNDDGDGFNSYLFSSVETAKEAIQEFLDEPDGQDMDSGQVSTTREDLGWEEIDFDIFELVRPKGDKAI